MAQNLFRHASRIASTCLNYLSPSLLPDIVLHPLDFATVLLQIGYDPEGVKDETATLMSVLVQYALFTVYIPYFLTSMQGIQFMGMPQPGLFYYINYIYKKEGLVGCYRGLVPKICERLVMIHTNEGVRQLLNKGQSRRSSQASTSRYRDSTDEDQFLRILVNCICCHFFAVVASHPFHVIMVSSFAEFRYGKKSKMGRLAADIFEKDGYFGFFAGLAPRLVGELLSLIFSIVYTSLVNKQFRSGQDGDTSNISAVRETVVNYVTEISRFTGFNRLFQEEEEEEEGRNQNQESPTVSPRYSSVLVHFLNNLVRGGPFRTNAAADLISYGVTPITDDHGSRRNLIQRIQDHTYVQILLTYVPLTSKLFYYMIIRDIISKKIAYPFFLVCHCMIILDTGWDKLPLLPYMEPFVRFIYFLVPRRKRDTCPI